MAKRTSPKPEVSPSSDFQDILADPEAYKRKILAQPHNADIFVEMRKTPITDPAFQRRPGKPLRVLK